MGARLELAAVVKEPLRMLVKLYFISCFLVLFLGGCQHYESFDEMAQAMCSGRAKDITFDEVPIHAQWIDVRSDAEYRVSHLNGARHCEWDGNSLHIINSLDPTRPVVVYCSVGYRSEKAAEYLMDKGFVEVYNLYGGIFKLVNEQNAMDSLGRPIARVHGFNPTWAKWITKGEIVYE